MTSPKIDIDKIEVRKLTRDILGLDTFKCSKTRFATYLQITSFQDQQARIGQTWVFTYENQIVGFITISMADMNKKEHVKMKTFRYGNIPALLIGQIATHSDFEKLGIGKKMIQYAISEARKYSKSIGCRIVMLNPDPDVIEWYKHQKFMHVPHKNNSMDIMFVDLGLM